MNFLKKLKLYQELSVAEQSILTITVALAGAFLALGNFSFLSILILIIIIEALMVIGYNSINCVFDADIDAISEPHRPIPSGKIL